MKNISKVAKRLSEFDIDKIPSAKLDKMLELTPEQQEDLRTTLKEVLGGGR